MSNNVKAKKMKRVSMKQQVNALPVCKYEKSCGACSMQSVAYIEQLQQKQAFVDKVFHKEGEVQPIIGMNFPYYYRNKCQAVFVKRNGRVLYGTYEQGTHHVVPIDHCQIQDKVANGILKTVAELLQSFKVHIYNEDTGTGDFRYCLIRKGFQSGQVMVVLVVANPVFPSKKNFVKALREQHPEITTVVLNINERTDNMILGEREEVLYGKGMIEDTLMGTKFLISSRSFYQINSLQTKKLYQKAIEGAHLTGKERILDAYCGIGTIGLIAAKNAAELIGVELNGDAVRDARKNVKRNGYKNAQFFCGDAGEYMVEAAKRGERFDVVFMDPPRAGSDDAFLASLVKLSPKRVVYVSCNPLTQERDVKVLKKGGYQVESLQPVDMFPFTDHVENICVLTKA